MPIAWHIALSFRSSHTRILKSFMDGNNFPQTNRFLSKSNVGPDKICDECTGNEQSLFVSLLVCNFVSGRPLLCPLTNCAQSTTWPLQINRKSHTHTHTHAVIGCQWLNSRAQQHTAPSIETQKPILISFYCSGTQWRKPCATQKCVRKREQRNANTFGQFRATSTWLWKRSTRKMRRTNNRNANGCIPTSDNCEWTRSSTESIPLFRFRLFFSDEWLISNHPYTYTVGHAICWLHCYAARLMPAKMSRKSRLLRHLSLQRDSEALFEVYF